jgi:hypothetical protein
MESVFEFIRDVILMGLPLSESGISETWIGVGVLAAVVAIVVAATRFLG